MLDSICVLCVLDQLLFVLVFFVFWPVQAGQTTTLIFLSFAALLLKLLSSVQLGARCARVVAAGSMPENPSEVAGPIGVRDSSGCLCVAVCSSTCLQEWATLLRACGWRGSNDRLFELCNMIVSNDIFAWYQMGRGGDPGAWHVETQQGSGTKACAFVFCVSDRCFLFFMIAGPRCQRSRGWIRACRAEI